MRARVDAFNYGCTVMPVHAMMNSAAQALLTRFGNEQFIEITGTIGYYSLLCMTANACELEPSPEHEVLKV